MLIDIDTRDPERLGFGRRPGRSRGEQYVRLRQEGRSQADTRPSDEVISAAVGIGNELNVIKRL
ncbi:hypothetical protein [Streptomyces sp. YIM 121038]|uniref:hypothetical protein n=1 Tax=Streptomyces sp. YIM 121038 TaxID=2136401 RepID=UPI001110C46C|nr:hypothetical protein [Streptomyces sp. YIM 121038]